MGTPESLAEMTDELCRRGRVAAKDVARLRRSIFPDGTVSENETEAVFRIDAACADKDPGWTQLYVDALTDYFVWQSNPRGYVDETLAERLIARILRDGRIEATSELELLINIVHRATWCPDALKVLALAAVRDSVLHPATAAYGSNRPPAVVSAGDVAILRKVLYGPAGDGGITVTRAEAEVVFDLNDATRGQKNAPEWREFFVKAIANYLMFPRSAPVVPSADEERRREAWLAERRGVGQLIHGVGAALARRDVPFAEAWREFDPTGAQRARDEQDAEDRRAREALRREAIDADEARWLAERLLRDGGIDDNEHALLRFIRDHAPAIDPTLESVMAREAI